MERGVDTKSGCVKVVSSHQHYQTVDVSEPEPQDRNHIKFSWKCLGIGGQYHETWCYKMVKITIMAQCLSVHTLMY